MVATGIIPGGKVARAWCRPLTPIQHWGWRKNRPIAVLPLWAFMACFSMNFTFYSDCPWLFWKAAMKSFCCIQQTLVTSYKEVYKYVQEKVKQLKSDSWLIFILSLCHTLCHSVQSTCHCSVRNTLIPLKTNTVVIVVFKWLHLGCHDLIFPIRSYFWALLFDCSWEFSRTWILHMVSIVCFSRTKNTNLCNQVTFHLKKV
jgi:hypothetical protein